MKTFLRRLSAFTLIEIAVVVAVIGILALMVLPSVVDTIETAREGAETSSLENVTEDIRRSFQETNWDRNISALTGEIPTTSYPSITNFGTAGPQAQNGDWFVKVGRLRGIVPVLGGEISESAQKSIYDIANNAYYQPRWLVAGPSETGQQRYLLISLMSAPSNGLVIPANDGSAAWFDAIWNNSWESKGATLPGYWATLLNTAQQLAWMHGRGTTTNVHRLIVKRIVQPKFTVTLNNTHPSYTGWLDYNGQTSLLTSAPSSGPSTTPEILSGRLIVCRRGLTAPGSEAYRIYLNENSSFNVTP